MDKKPDVHYYKVEEDKIVECPFDQLKKLPQLAFFFKTVDGKASPLHEISGWSEPETEKKDRFVCIHQPHDNRIEEIKDKDWYKEYLALPQGKFDWKRKKRDKVS